jgi:ketosteroid isomerase-like protein
MEPTVMEPTDVVTQYWRRTQARDWAGVTALLAPGLVVEWPVSGERFTSREPFVDMNRAYPEGWSIQVMRVVQQGDVVVSEVRVPHVEFGVVIALSFWKVNGGVIAEGTEYWVTPGSEEPPAWRSSFADRYDPLASASP